MKDFMKRGKMWNDSRWGCDCRPVEANVNMCRQKELRGADRREMASTCYIAGPPPSLPHSCMTHMHVNLHAGVYLCGCLAVCPLPSVLSCASGGRQRDGCPLFSLPLVLSSSILLLSHTRECILPCSPLVFLSIYLSLIISFAAVCSFRCISHPLC